MELPVFLFIGPQRVVLLKDYKLPNNRYIPKGFESDLGSIPFLFQWFLRPTDIKYAAIIHDFDWLMADFGHYDYQEANKSFYRNCIELDRISKWKARVCYGILEVIRHFKECPLSF
jgi:hypothetical protein